MRRAAKAKRRVSNKKRKKSVRQAVPKRYLPHRRMTLQCPEQLHIERDKAAAEAVITFVCQLHNAIKDGKHDRVIIDHRPLIDASPASVLVLLAYTHHAMQTQPRVQLQAYLPTNQAVLSILDGVGYFQYYQQTVTLRPENNSGILGHLRESGVKQAALAAFIRPLPAGLIKTSLLYEALIEAAQNTDEWAYRREQPDRFWWLLACHPPKSGEISICFIDLGVGIPTTIRTRFLDRLPGPFSVKGSELIQKAVMEGHYSRTKKENRGRGLPTLRRLIDSVAQGEMTVVSRGSYFRYSKAKETPKSPVLACELRKGSDLRGTVITWKIAKP